MNKIKQYIKKNKKKLIALGVCAVGATVISKVSFAKGFYKSASDIGEMLRLAAYDNPDMGLMKFYETEIATGNLPYDYYDLVRRGVKEIKIVEF